ncbi:Holliday junction branch migration protein RuvA [Actinoalloteichus sp. AHMU CJ021]|uniref:Holliday junction branch migration complex subunit RuvA n=1 Tax=Actinoalloteichus caeruleus DSM 43889 TaxID=1120930 RepID=A0ABT1JG78_ACTCY|nr:Holliday junction branch migration protein RuvA [Actinoalloteichus caeruleus]AUS77603.1 Holliday junction branch migration protein RuvA [Actinoalloteichus sp. AHMU CJ021]MCP2331493.1 Holliday junction DNA helicase subunit RuvA [Actinoalloteichus caeruleus DSM 43889]
MISSVRGTVRSVGLDHAVVEVSGIGLAVRTTPTTLAGLRRGEQVELVTSLVIREDSWTLYGFPTDEVKELFELLQTVSGVGPRLALAMLAVLEPDQLRTAVSEGNLTTLTQVPGIGRKGAERLVVELRDKLGPVAPAGGGDGAAAPDAGQRRTHVVEALVGLGFTAKQAEQAVEKVLATDGGGDTSGILRKSLALLGRKR